MRQCRGHHLRQGGSMIEFKELICGTCGVHHWIPTAMYEAKRSEGGFWHYPNGHSRGFGTGTIAHERDRLKQQLAQRDDEFAELVHSRNKAEVALSKAEVALSKAKRRA